MPLSGVWIDTLPGSGVLRWNGNAVSAGDFVMAADIASGLLTYLPQPDAAGSALASFHFRVQDDGGAASGGSDTDASANTITLHVTAVNDAPLITHGGSNLVSNGSFESGTAGWVSNGTIEVSSDSAAYGLGTVADGSFFAEVEGWDPTAAATYLEQTVATEIGRTYTLKWSVATRNGVNTADMGSVSLNGVELDRFTAGTDWSDRGVTFTATSTSSTLRFTSLGSQTGETTPNGGTRPADRRRSPAHDRQERERGGRRPGRRADAGFLGRRPGTVCRRQLRWRQPHAGPQRRSQRAGSVQRDGHARRVGRGRCAGGGRHDHRPR